MPRELSLKQGHIYSKPARELENLRLQKIDIDADRTSRIDSKLFEGTEIDLNIKFGSARKISLALDYDGEIAKFEYDLSTQIFTIDREGMKLGGRGQRRFKIFADDSIKLQIFVDKTAMFKMVKKPRVSLYFQRKIRFRK